MNRQCCNCNVSALTDWKFSANLRGIWELAVVTYCDLLLKAPTCSPEAVSSGLTNRDLSLFVV